MKKKLIIKYYLIIKKHFNIFFYYDKMNNSISSNDNTEIMDDRLSIESNKNQILQILNFLPIRFNRNDHDQNNSFSSLDFESIVILDNNSLYLHNNKYLHRYLLLYLFLHILFIIMIFYYTIS
jgi:hypothetical protein